MLEQFGGRPLTQHEYEAALRIEKKRSRWFWIMMLPVALLLAIVMLMLVNSASEKALNRACLRELGLDPQHEKANYNAYCMVEYHNHVHGTEIDYFSKEERRQVSQELEEQMREAYFLGYLYAPEDERVSFEPEYTFEQFNQRIHSIAEETRARLAPTYDAKIHLCRAIGAGMILLVAVMILFPAGKRHLLAREIVCRRGMMSLPFTSMLSWKRMIYFETADMDGPEYDHCLKAPWWQMIPSETKLVMKTEELPVLLVMADGKLMYYPIALLDAPKT